MKSVSIQFFSPQDNSQPSQKGATKQTSKAILTGSISATGKLILSPKIVDQLAFDPAAARFKIGIEQGKRKIKSLYLIPASEDYSNTFELVKKANTYSIALAFILQKGGVDYKRAHYIFTLKPFEYEAGITAYELRLDTQAPKPPYTGRPRGRGVKSAFQAQPSASAE